VTKLAEVGT